MFERHISTDRNIRDKKDHHRNLDSLFTGVLDEKKKSKRNEYYMLINRDKIKNL